MKKIRTADLVTDVLRRIQKTIVNMQINVKTMMIAVNMRFVKRVKTGPNVFLLTKFVQMIHTVRKDFTAI